MSVFISYTKNDQSLFDTLALACRQAGLTLSDSTDLEPGQPLADQLRDAIEHCELCIFLATVRSLASHWCSAELGAFWGAGKPVIIYVADPQVDRTQLPPQFAGMVPTADVERLLQVVTRLVGERAVPSTPIDRTSRQRLLADCTETGVRRIFPNRLAVDTSHGALNKLIASATRVNIASLLYHVPQSGELKKSLLSCVRGGGQVRVLLSDPESAALPEDRQPLEGSQPLEELWPLRLRQYAEDDLLLNRMIPELKETLHFLADLREDLTAESQHFGQDFNVRLLSHYVMYTGISQIDDLMLLTFYCDKQRGNGSPTVLLEGPSESGSWFSLFVEEFEYLWARSRRA